MNWHYAQIKNCDDRIQVQVHKRILRELQTKNKEILEDIKKREQQKLADTAQNLSGKDFWRRFNARKGPAIAKDVDFGEFELFWGNLFKHDKNFGPESTQEFERPDVEPW